MGNLGGGEILVIMLLALIVLGPQRLPDAAKQIGRFMGEVRRVSNGFQHELRTALDDPAEQAARARGAAFRPAKPDGPAVAPVEPADPIETTATAAADEPATAPEPTAAPAAKKRTTTKAAPRKRAAPLRAASKPADGSTAG